MPIAAIEAAVKEMCTLQKHGGPDDEGVYCCGEHHLAFGHRRLSLIDLSRGGHQPMPYDNGRYQITYNGELYNYAELKLVLQKMGVLFTTASDTEVILAAFATWGTAAFKQFSGMFAFAIWDSLTGDVYLVRDPAGMKPLYFAHTAQGLAFASEVRAFKVVHYLQTPHPQWQVYLMAYGHLPEPITTLKDVTPLTKGSFLRYNVFTGAVQREAFGRFNFVEQLDNRQQAIELIRHSLASGVKKHLLSDAPIGVFLSGGLDSSIIALLASNEKKNLTTVSLIFKEQQYSEQRFQDIVQQDLRGNPYQQVLTEEAFHRDMPSIFRAMDLPSCDGINTWFISKYAREAGLKAVLSGVGGDELYGGYPSFKRIGPALQLQHQVAAGLLRRACYTGLKKFKRLCYLSIKSTAGMYLFLRGQFIPQQIAAYLNADEAQVWSILEQEPLLPVIANLTAKNQASWMELNLYMQNQLLRDVDVMSMAHGLEIRLPFLDTAFVKLSLQLSSNIKYRGPNNKQLLIDSFKDILPQEVWNRPKMGFAFPFADWLAKDQYAQAKTGSKSAAYHQQFVAGKLHWSQFLTVFLIENQADA
jgi:asparagine synthase (glutamine-hydrolysing)